MTHPVGKKQIYKRFHRRGGHHTIVRRCKNQQIRFPQRKVDLFFVRPKRTVLSRFEAGKTTCAKVIQVSWQKELLDVVFCLYVFEQFLRNMPCGALMILPVNDRYFHFPPQPPICRFLRLLYSDYMSFSTDYKKNPHDLPAERFAIKTTGETGGLFCPYKGLLLALPL